MPEIKKYKIVVYAIGDSYGPGSTITLRSDQDRGLSKSDAVARARGYFVHGYIVDYRDCGISVFRPTSISILEDKEQ